MSSKGRARPHQLWNALEAQHVRYSVAVSTLMRASDLPIKEALALQDDLRRYFCLRCAGFLEQVTYEILTEFLIQKSGGPVHSFATSYFPKSPNLNARAFETLIGRFGKETTKSLEEFMTEERREGLNTLLEIRNLVAHGKDIGGAKLDPAGHYETCRATYRWLLEEFLPEIAAEPSSAT